MKTKSIILSTLFIFFLLMLFTGCHARTVEDEKTFYSEGFDILRQCNDNISVKSFKINTNSGWLNKYKKYKLTNQQQAYYDIILDIAKLNNKYKNTDDLTYVRQMTNKIKELTKFANNNKT